MSQSPVMVVERRRVPRRVTRVPAYAIVDGGVRRGCTVGNLSSDGARLVFGAVAPLPLRFELRFANGKRVKVQLIWQRNVIAGVRFDKPLTIWEWLAPRT
jgi:PilZ domain